MPGAYMFPTTIGSDRPGESSPLVSFDGECDDEHLLLRIPFGRTAVGVDGQRQVDGQEHTRRLGPELLRRDVQVEVLRGACVGRARARASVVVRVHARVRNRSHECAMYAWCTWTQNHLHRVARELDADGHVCAVGRAGRLLAHSQKHVLRHDVLFEENLILGPWPSVLHVLHQNGLLSGHLILVPDVFGVLLLLLCATLLLCPPTPAGLVLDPIAADHYRPGVRRRRVARGAVGILLILCQQVGERIQVLQPEVGHGRGCSADAVGSPPIAKWQVGPF
mmetsp:Transcript_38065/g.87759  ORF Transcript_38065/g.87759 Transcript_38065/m.87759 type:complete len:279 (-) Transcript_38065:79-915(-)